MAAARPLKFAEIVCADFEAVVNNDVRQGRTRVAAVRGHNSRALPDSTPKPSTTALKTAAFKD